MRVGISGASGKLGAAVLKHVRERLPSAEVVGISRTPDAIATPGVERRRGDFNEPSSLVDAYAGLRRLLIIPSNDMRPGARTLQGRDAIRCAVDAGVEQIVIASVLGTRQADFPHVWQSYFVAEQVLMQLARKWTILRMAYYAESFIDEVQTTLPYGAHTSLADTPVNFVWRDDVAAAAASILVGDGHFGAIYHATGPAALSGHERAAIVAKLTGKSYHFAKVTREQYANGVNAGGLPPFIVDALLGIQHMWSVGGFDIVSGDVERLSGRPPRSLEDALRSALA